MIMVSSLLGRTFSPQRPGGTSRLAALGFFILALLGAGVALVQPETAQWAEANRGSVAKLLAEVTGIELDIQTIAANRSSFAIGKITDDIVATQQKVADRFYKLGLIPKPVVVREAVWVPPQS